MVRIFTPSFAASRDGRARRTPEFERWYRPVERHMNDLPFGATLGVWDCAQSPLRGARSPISRSRRPCSRDQTINRGRSTAIGAAPFTFYALAPETHPREMSGVAPVIGPRWFHAARPSPIAARHGAGPVQPRRRAAAP